MIYARCIFLIALIPGIAMAQTSPSTQPSPDPRFTIGKELFHEPLNDTKQFLVELEKGGTVEAKEGTLTIDVPAGCTVWFKPVLEGPVMIEYEAQMISAGGPNDRVSDLNCFWMARDVRGPDALEAHNRSGKFTDYNQLKGYYVGFGGNANTTTRFRRYIGDKELRPLLPEHDLNNAENLLKPNVWQRVRIVAAGKLIQYYHNDHKVFELNDLDPYTSGWFGFRTVTAHQQIRNFHIRRLQISE